MEAVRGAECYIFDANYTEKSPWHNTILPFTRNVMGPMDYTPVTFSDNNHPHLTTSGHELALSVVFESGWQHFADRVEAYRDLSPGPKSFLKDVPVTWDDIRFISGNPGESVILARRKGVEWYIGGISGLSVALDSDISLDFLEEGFEYKSVIITDGESDRDLKTEAGIVTHGQSLSLSMRARGGFVCRLTRNAEN
jgi:hypothetical protein